MIELVASGESLLGFNLTGSYAPLRAKDKPGIGGVMPWAQRYIVERYRWLMPAEFAAMLGLCQIMPGPNVMNLAVCLGILRKFASGTAHKSQLDKTHDLSRVSFLRPRQFGSRPAVGHHPMMFISAIGLAHRKPCPMEQPRESR